MRYHDTVMDTQQKLDILSRDAQYDLSCSCGTPDTTDHRRRSSDGSAWLYPVTAASGGSSIMLKTLMGNRCSNDCRYCPLRSTQDFRPALLSPDEVASFFIDLARQRQLVGLFLSSAVIGTSDKTMQLLIDTAKILRQRYRYRGFIHLKVIPGCSLAAIDEALKYASALSLNIEVPSKDHFARLCSRQDWDDDIIAPLHYLAAKTAAGTEYAGVGISSQFIVGASDESDRQIIGRVNELYSTLGVERIYYSAYQRGLGDASIPGEQRAPIEPDLFGMERSSQPLMREHRLYQADWLLRVYGFGHDELIFGDDGQLSLERDPKRVWAEANADRFPLSVNRASKEELLRVPGIGPVWANRIIAQRRRGRIGALDSLGLPLSLTRAAQPFLCV